MTKTVYVLAALALLAQVAATGVARAQSASAGAGSNGGGEGTFDPVNNHAGMVGNVALEGWSYNDGTR